MCLWGLDQDPFAPPVPYQALVDQARSEFPDYAGSNLL